VFVADRDATNLEQGIVCRPQQQVETTLRTAYYLSRTLKFLRDFAGGFP
jgi:hypothetical protein